MAAHAAGKRISTRRGARRAITQSCSSRCTLRCFCARRRSPSSSASAPASTKQSAPQMSPSSLGIAGAVSTRRCADDAHVNNCTKPIPPSTIAQPSASGVKRRMGIWEVAKKRLCAPSLRSLRAGRNMASRWRLLAVLVLLAVVVCSAANDDHASREQLLSLIHI